VGNKTVKLQFQRFFALVHAKQHSYDHFIN